MPIIRATVTLDADSGLPEDSATNTYHFDANDGGPGPVAQNMLDLLVNLYATPAAATPLMQLMANDLSAGTGTVRLYNLDDPEPRAPYAQRTMTRAGGVTSGLPAEVSLCCSFQANPESGEPQSRRRGRIYLPWFGEGQNVGGRPTQALIDDIGEAFVEFGAAADNSLSVDWVVYSPTNNSAVGVANGWIDNAWDTQRRRGFAPTVRTSWP